MSTETLYWVFGIWTLIFPLIAFLSQLPSYTVGGKTDWLVFDKIFQWTPILGDLVRSPVVMTGKFPWFWLVYQMAAFGTLIWIIVSL